MKRLRAAMCWSEASPAEAWAISTRQPVWNPTAQVAPSAGTIQPTTTLR